jgi:hypothetical protein
MRFNLIKKLLKKTILIYNVKLILLIIGNEFFIIFFSF